MGIFVRMGYVSRRRGAKLHVIVGGIARCHSGSGWIIGTSLIDQDSAPRICRHCAEALRTQLIYRSDDLYKIYRGRTSPEVYEIHALIDALDPVEAERGAAMLAEIRDNLRRTGVLWPDDQSEDTSTSRPAKTPASAATPDGDQPSLF